MYARVHKWRRHYARGIRGLTSRSAAAKRHWFPKGGTKIASNGFLPLSSRDPRNLCPIILPAANQAGNWPRQQNRQSDWLARKQQPGGNWRGREKERERERERERETERERDRERDKEGLLDKFEEWLGYLFVFSFDRDLNVQMKK